MRELALTKITRDGRVVTVTIEKPDYGPTVTVARVSGQEVGSHVGPHHKVPGLPAGYVAAVGQLALTADEAATVEAAYRTFQDSLSPDHTAVRRRLVEAIDVAEAAWAETRQAAWDAFDGGGNPFAQDAANEQRILAARRVLREFDAAHPDVAAGAAADRDSDVDRWLAQ